MPRKLTTLAYCAAAAAPLVSCALLETPVRSGQHCASPGGKQARYGFSTTAVGGTRFFIDSCPVARQASLAHGLHRGEHQGGANLAERPSIDKGSPSSNLEITEIPLVSSQMSFFAQHGECMMHGRSGSLFRGYGSCLHGTLKLFVSLPIRRCLVQN